MKGEAHNRAITVTCIAGILVSTYALYVEMAVEAYPGYTALCDIAERASCSRVLSSKFSKGFGILSKDSPLGMPNCVYGIIFYCFIIFLTTFNNATAVRLQYYMSLAAVASCFYLAYLLIFVLYDLCVVCVSTYVVNGAITLLTYQKMVTLNVKND